MAKDPKISLDKNLAAHEKKSEINFIDAKRKTISSLKIANFMDGSVKPSSQIGFEKERIKYLFNQKKVETRVEELRKQNIPEAEIFQRVLEDETLYQKMPEDYAEFYQVNPVSKIIYSSGQFEPSRSNDKFYIQYKAPDLVGQTSIEVEVRTNKDFAKVPLHAVLGQPGVFVSEELVLVSNPITDSNPKTNQTIVAEVGDSVQVSYQRGQETYKAQAQVPLERVLPLQFIILKNDKGEPLATAEDVKRHVAFAQESLNYTHTKIQNLEIVYYQPPADSGIMIEDGLNEIERLMIADLTKAYAPQPGVRVFLSGNAIGDRENGQSVEDHSYSQRKFGNFSRYDVANTIFLKTDASRFALGHALGHLVFGALDERDYKKLNFDSEGHSQELLDLMFLGSAAEREKNMFHPGQYLKDAEVKAFQNSPLLIQPNKKSSSHETSFEYREGLRFVPSP